MGMSLGLKTENFAPAEDQSWLGSAHGTQSMDSITLDAALTVAIPEFADGLVPSSVPLGRVTATGRYAPAVTGATDGSADVVGHLFTTTSVTAGGKTAPTNTPASLLWHGEVITARIPAYTGRPAADAASIRYV